MEDLTLKMKAEVDTSGVDKDLSKVADETAKAYQKAYEGLTNTVQKSFSEMKENLDQLKSSDGISGIFEKATKAVELYNSEMGKLKSTANMDPATSKLYNLERELAAIARQILTVKTDFDALNKAAEVKIDLEKEFGSFEAAEKKLQELREERDKLQNVVPGEYDHALLGDMSKQLAEIDKMKSSISELFKMRQMLISSGDTSEATVSSINVINKTIQSLNQNLMQASKEFYNVGRENGFGKINSEITENVRNLEQWRDVLQQIHDLSTRTGQTRLTPGMAAAPTQLGSLSAELDQTIQKMTDVVNKEDEIASGANRVASSFSQWRNVVWSVSRLLGNVYTIGLDIVRGAKKVANIYKSIWNYIKTAVTWLKKLRDESHKTALDHAKSFLSMLKDIVRYSLGIRSLFALFRRLRRYIKEAFEALAEQVPEVNATMSELLSSFNMVKGSLATAFEPIVTAIAPMLDFLMEKLAQVMTYIGMFFAALTGRGYVYKANKSMTSFADTTKKAADNQKELNKQLQKFDELNNLTTQKDKKSGKAAKPPLATFEKVDIPDWIKDLAQKLKDIFNRIMDPIRRAWEKVGDYVVEAWKRAFNSVKDLLHDIFRDFLRAWDELGESIATHFFLIIGDIGNIIANIADAIREAWNTNENGYKIWKAILTIVDKILAGIREITKSIRDWTATLNLIPLMTAIKDWLESLVPLVEAVMKVLLNIWERALKPILDWAFNGEDSGLARFFNILRDFNEKLDLDKIVDDLNRIWDALGRFGQTVGEGLLIFMERMLGYLADWLNSDEFTEWCQAIADFFDNIHPEDIADKLEQVWRILKNVKDAIWDVIKLVIDHIDFIMNVLEFVSKWLKWIVGGGLVAKLAIDIGRLVANIKLYKGAVQIAKGVSTALEGAGTSAAVTGAASTLGTIIGVGIVVAIGSAIAFKLADILAQALGYEGGWREVKEIIQQQVDDIVKIIEDGMIPATEELEKVAHLNTYGDSAAAGKQMDEFHDKIIQTHDDLNALTDALDENNIKVKGHGLAWKDNVNALEQISEGFTILESNGNNVDDMLVRLQDEYGKVDSSTKKFFDHLKEGDEAYVAVQETMRKSGTLVEQTTETTVQGFRQIEDSYQKTKDKANSYEEAIRQGTELSKQAMNELHTAHMETANSTDQAASSAEGLKSSLDNTANSAENLAEKVELSADMVENMLEQMKSQVADADWAEIWSPVKTGFEEFWATFKTDVETDVQTFMGEIPGIISSNLDMNTILQPIDTGVSEFMNTVKTTVTTKIGEITTTVVDGITNMKVSIDSSLQGINEMFGNAFNGIGETITSMLQSMNEAWVSGLQNMNTSYAEAWRSMLQTTQQAVRQIGNMLNQLMSQLQRIPQALNQTMQQMNRMSQQVSRMNISQQISSRLRVPHLATGAVIPPNNEFLAVLGDQSRGTNIESPLSTMVEAFNQANKGGSEAELALLQEQNDLLRQLLNKEFGISESAIFKSVRNQNSIFTKSTGHSAFV